MEEKNKSNQNIDPISNGQTTGSFNASTGENNKKKGKIILSIIIIALMLAIVAGLAYYFTVYTQPDEIYKRVITSTMNSYTNNLNNMDYRTSKTSWKLNADLDTDKIDEKIKDLINKTDVGIEVQTDNETKKFLVDVQADYDKEDLLDFQMCSDISEKKTYMQLKNLLDKYIEMEDINDEFYSVTEELFNNEKMTASKNAMKILNKELTNVVKKEYCTAQKEDVTVNNKTIHATKNIIKMNVEQFKNECITVFENLKNNEEFMNCFEEKDEIEEVIEDTIEQLEDIETADDESAIELAMYTEGLAQKVIKFTATISDSEKNEILSMEVLKTEDNTYDFEILEEKNSILKGTIKVEEKSKTEGTIQLQLDIEEFGKIKFNMEYSQKFNEDIDTVDVSDAVKTEELTNSDQQTLLNNLEKSKLYELIESFSGSQLMKDTTTNYDYNYTNDDDMKTSSSLDNNQIITYDEKYKIIFKIPSGYKVDYASENYKTLKKDDTIIRISAIYGNNANEYKELQSRKEYFEEDSYYNNVQLSEMKTMQINGRTYYEETLSYEYSTSVYNNKYESKYIWTEIDNNNLIQYEIVSASDMTEEELNDVLTIQVEKNK